MTPYSCPRGTRLFDPVRLRANHVRFHLSKCRINTRTSSTPALQAFILSVAADQNIPRVRPCHTTLLPIIPPRPYHNHPTARLTTCLRKIHDSRHTRATWNSITTLPRQCRSVTDRPLLLTTFHLHYTNTNMTGPDRTFRSTFRRLLLFMTPP